MDGALASYVFLGQSSAHCSAVISCPARSLLGNVVIQLASSGVVWCSLLTAQTFAAAAGVRE